MKKRKICIITGTRAEFGLLQWLMKDVQDDNDLCLQIIASGMHLSPEFGLTYKEIEAAGLPIDKKVEILLSSDSSIGVSKSMGLGMISFAEAFEELKPDIIVVLGDRFEMFSAVAAAMISRIPVAHIHGGEKTEGAVDESIRHCITKMSHLHFTATEEYRKRVIQLGENPDRVFFTGSPGLDNLTRLHLLNKKEFEKSINFSLGKKNLLITFHPATLEKNSAEYQFKQLLKALDHFNEAHLIFTMPNADTDGRIIVELINHYVNNNKDRSCAFTSLGQIRYLSALQYMDAVVGNSSSGLTEAPSFKVPTVNIGDRQKGRIKAKSVIDCAPEELEIKEAIRKALDEEFKSKLIDLVNPYGGSGASNKIKNIISSTNLNTLLKKEFYDL